MALFYKLVKKHKGVFYDFSQNQEKSRESIILNRLTNQTVAVITNKTNAIEWKADVPEVVKQAVKSFLEG